MVLELASGPMVSRKIGPSSKVVGSKSLAGFRCNDSTSLVVFIIVAVIYN